jgi:hypothetical protein
VAETPAFELGVVRSGSPSDLTGWGVAWAVLLGGLLCGATLGCFQWLLLRGHRVSVTWWVLASTAGFTLGYVVVWLLGGASYGEAYGNHALPHSLDGAGLPGGALLGAVLGMVTGGPLLWLLAQPARPKRSPGPAHLGRS